MGPEKQPLFPELSEMIDTEEMQQLMDDFYAATRLPMSLVDMQGKVLVGVGWQKACTDFHRVHPLSRQNCLESDTLLTQGIAPGEYRLYRCKNQMWDLATPVVVEATQVGNIFMGQFFFDDEEVDYEVFRKQARQYQYNEELYLDAIKNTPRISREVIAPAMRFFSGLSSMISTQVLSQHRLQKSLDENRSLLAEITKSQDHCRQLADHYHRFFEKDITGDYLSTPEGQLLDCNPAFVELLGYASKEELLSTNMSQIYPATGDRDVFLKTLRRDKNISNAEIQMLRKDGKVIYCLENVLGIFDEKNELVRFQGYMMDITSRKASEQALKENEELFRKLVMTVPEMIIRTNLDGIIFFINKQLIPALLHYPDDFFLGKNLLSFIDPEDMDKAVANSRLMLKKPLGPQEYRLRLGENQVLDCEVNGDIILDARSKPNGMVYVIRDITERKKQEASQLEKQLRQERYTSHLSELISQGRFLGEELRENLSAITRITSHIIESERVSIWLYNTDLSRIECYDLYQRSIDQHSSGEVLLTSVFPDYTTAHKFGEIIAVEDVMTDPRTKTIPAAYLQQHDIRSLLDAPVWIEGRLSALLSCEHCGEHRQWLPEEKQILQTLAAYISSCIEANNKKVAEENLRQSESRFRLMVKNSSDIIVLIDADGTQRYISPAAERITGYLPEELTGKNISEVIHPDDMPAIVQEWHRAIELPDQLARVQYRHIHKSRGWVDLEAIGQNFLQEPSVNAVVASVRDVSERKKQEAEIMLAKEKAEESDRLKTAFLNNLSHEIRTPMNAIVGFADLVNDPGMNTEKRAQLTRIILQSSEQLLSIINDILTIATIEAGQDKVQEKPCSITAAFQLLHEQFQLKASAKGIDLQYESMLEFPDDSILVDETKLLQILCNLIGNAIKFTRQGYVKFSCFTKDNELLFQVEDTGIGIPADMFGFIFERFRQVETSVGKQHGGSGLGLSISKAYVELLGGKIWLSSDPGKGSVFFFTIPYNKTDIEMKQPVKAESFQRFSYDQSKNILIAEDEDINYLLIEKIMLDAGLTITRVENGQEAVQYCRDHPEVDLVIMDLKMPVLNGYEAAKQIRELLPDLPILALTAYSSEVDKNRAIDCGCSGFVSKPFRRAELMKTIGDYLAEKK